jgi:hypothetical protein
VRYFLLISIIYAVTLNAKPQSSDLEFEQIFEIYEQRRKEAALKYTCKVHYWLKDGLTIKQGSSQAADQYRFRAAAGVAMREVRASYGADYIKLLRASERAFECQYPTSNESSCILGLNYLMTFLEKVTEDVSSYLRACIEPKEEIQKI